MQRESVLRDQYQIQSNNAMQNFESISPLHASVDPRFSSLFVRAANYRELASQQKVSPTSNSIHSPSIVTVNSNVWLPTQTANEKLATTEK
jgi:hypothetical protein